MIHERMLKSRLQANCRQEAVSLALVPQGESACLNSGRSLGQSQVTPRRPQGDPKETCWDAKTRQSKSHTLSVRSDFMSQNSRMRDLIFTSAHKSDETTDGFWDTELKWDTQQIGG